MDETKAILIGGTIAGIIFLLFILILVMGLKGEPPNPFTDCMDECGWLDSDELEADCLKSCQEHFADTAAQYYREQEDDN